MNCNNYENRREILLWKNGLSTVLSMWTIFIGAAIFEMFLGEKYQRGEFIVNMIYLLILGTGVFFYSLFYFCHCFPLHFELPQNSAAL